MKKVSSILLFALIFSIGVSVFAGEIKTGSISGKVMIKDGMPMADGVVYIFNDASGPPPSFDRYWRVPDEIVKTDAAGKFLAKLSDGTYYIGAIKRNSGEDVGPLREGDLFLPFHDGNTPKQFKIFNGSATDIGIISGAIPYKRANLKTMDGITAIEGKITDINGKPVENAMVFAFLTPAMLGKPLFIAEKTGNDGQYQLRVDRGGNYYLKIRNVYGGGAMKAGEIMGSYGQDKPEAVDIKTGTVVKGINITVINFTGQGLKKK